MNPPTPLLGVPFEVIVAGLTPGEVVTILVLAVGLGTSDPPRTATADAGGIARQSSINTNTSFQNWFARVTRADGRAAELQFSFSAAPAPPAATAPPPAANAGTSYCDTGTGPSGTRFSCVFLGLPPNAPIRLCFARVGTPSPQDSCSDVPNQPNGMLAVTTQTLLAVGTYTYTLTAGAQTQRLSITVTP